MWLTLYFLAWPAISLVVLLVLLVTLWRDLRAARKSGQAMI
ncbi:MULTISPECIES: putative transporter small subunit [Pseudomonas]|uniref:Transporter small subunit n=1 Tax=Pseudomonas sp. Hg7Tf TaxID=3236988 RepID=A0AB39I9F3_9PSED|nr:MULTISPECIES: putative transporter small subunit [Pseudomonas]MDD1979661.1 putative transporter small subunit [Pseudomonas putida]MDH2558802.1 putative transporter small subunit [Pseudomonas sp. Hg5Tf]QYX49396.1 putative transporter small subunit [Pseudomonas sp. S11A 273]